MAGERYDPDDGLVPESPPLPAVRVDDYRYEYEYMDEDEEMDWQPLNLEDLGCQSVGLFLSMDPSLQFNSPDLGPLVEMEDVNMNVTPRRAKHVQRMVLPLIIRGSPIVARPDSGSAANIASLDLIKEKFWEYDRSPDYQREFRVANGKYVKALGRILLEVVFAKDTSIAAICEFYIFQNLVTPVIMGMPFLEGTETFIKNKRCLEVQSLPVGGPLQICSLNSPRCQLHCQIDFERGLANLDTGSEADFMSLAYVRRRGIHMKGANMTSSMVQFADGSIAFLAGEVDINIVIGKQDGPSWFMTFLVLEGLTCDILLGEDFLYESEAFETYHEAFVESDPGEGCDANTIVLLRTAGSFLSRFLRNRPNKENQRGKCIRSLWFSSRSCCLKKRRGCNVG